MGAPQFMPSNYRRFAVDADADGRIDLWTNWPDVCASVGNYLQGTWLERRRAGAERGQRGARQGGRSGRPQAGTGRNRRVAAAEGRDFESPLPAEAPALLIAVDEADGVHWRVGYNNFYVITRYNHSALYAMAVYELAAAVKQRVLVNDAPRHRPPHRRRTAAAPPRQPPAPPPPHRAVNAARAAGRLARLAAVNAARHSCRGLLPHAPDRLLPPPGQRARRRRRRPPPPQAPCRMPFRASSPGRATAIRRSTMSSASATTSCPRARLWERGRRLLVWPRLPQGADLDRRALRHVRHDRRS